MALWTAYLSGTRVIGSLDGDNVLDLCADGTGQWVNGAYIDMVSLTGMEFEWEVVENAAGRWNEPHLIIRSQRAAEYTIPSRIVHKKRDGSIFTSLYPVGNSINTPINPKPVVFTNTQDTAYQFSETTQTVCRE